ncbi:MAG: hypothetical protein ABI284_07090 [Nitrosospira sp.]
MSLLKNRLTYLTISFVLLVLAFPLISIGTSQGPAWLWHLGLSSLITGGMIPPLYRLLSRHSTEAPPLDAPDDSSDEQKAHRR